jgi:hypothetical protein
MGLWSARVWRLRCDRDDHRPARAECGYLRNLARGWQRFQDGRRRFCSPRFEASSNPFDSAPRTIQVEVQSPYEGARWLLHIVAAAPARRPKCIARDSYWKEHQSTAEDKLRRGPASYRLARLQLRRPCWQRRFRLSGRFPWLRFLSWRLTSASPRIRARPAFAFRSR